MSTNQPVVRPQTPVGLVFHRANNLPARKKRYQNIGEKAAIYPFSDLPKNNQLFF
jgi:hypothetical protein